MNQNPFPYEAPSTAPIVATRDAAGDGSLTASTDADAVDELEVDVDVEIVLEGEPDSSDEARELDAAPAVDDSEGEVLAEAAADDDENEEGLDTGELAPIADDADDDEEPSELEVDSDEAAASASPGLSWFHRWFTGAGRRTAREART